MFPRAAPTEAVRAAPKGAALRHPGGSAVRMERASRGSTDMTGRHGNPYASILLDPEPVRLAMMSDRRERSIMAWRIARGIGASVDGVHNDRRPRSRVS